tara:strand:- start:8378 stop:9715 length:1338 start_codon:yes stop_codon:yes gene_type:complete
MNEQYENNAITLFLDTNSLLHYPPIKSVTWSKVTGYEFVKLILCLQVIHELDEKKDDPRLGGRAKRVIKEIKELRQRSEKQQILLEVFNYEVKASDFPESLSIDSKDDRIVLSAKKYSEAFPRERIAVYTEDMGMVFRCEANALQVIEPASDTRLESPHDELEKKYRQAITELNGLKNRLPKLQLCVTPVNGNPDLSEPYSCTLIDNWNPVIVDERVEAEKNQYPYMNNVASPQTPLGALEFFQNRISQTDVDNYNAKLDTYFLNFRMYLDRLNTWGSNNTRSFSFDLWLINSGNNPADDIDISLHFPTQICWVADVKSDEAKPLRRPSSPTPPEKPKPQSNLSPMHSFTMPEITPVSEQINRMLADREQDRVQVNRCQDESFLIEAKIGRVKHGLSRRFGRFTGVIANWNDVRPFQVEWRILASELPEVQTGSIPFILKQHGGE